MVIIIENGLNLTRKISYLNDTGKDIKGLYSGRAMAVRREGRPGGRGLSSELEDLVPDGITGVEEP